MFLPQLIEQAPDHKTAWEHYSQARSEYREGLLTLAEFMAANDAFGVWLHTHEAPVRPLVVLR